MLDLKKKNNRYEWIFLSQKTCASDKEKIELLIKNFCSECEIVDTYQELLDIKSDFDYYYIDYYNKGLIDDIDDISYLSTIYFYLNTNKNRVLRRKFKKISSECFSVLFFVFFLILFLIFLVKLFRG